MPFIQQKIFEELKLNMTNCNLSNTTPIDKLKKDY